MASTNTTNLNICTDKDIKLAAEKIFEELGLNMATAAAIEEGRHPDFYFPNASHLHNG
ncbi:MAG: type II restriction endonuclease [Lachnoclostridium sp.]|nr:type II restriction endonuclease [Lachnoclostridium sp.]MCM1384750.1 type II restriction endonuclease [Lachnoclostridium sp.]